MSATPLCATLQQRWGELCLALQVVTQLEDELARLVQSPEGAGPGNRRALPAAEDPARGSGPAIPGLNLGTGDGQQESTGCSPWAWR